MEATLSGRLALNATWMLHGQWGQVGTLTAARTRHLLGAGPGPLGKREIEQ